MCLIFSIAFMILFFSNKQHLIYLLPIVYILLGIGNSSYEMYDHIAIYETSKEKLQTSYVTFERFIEGLVTMLLPILSTILSGNKNIIKITFALSIITYIILFIYFRLKDNFKKTIS